MYPTIAATFSAGAPCRREARLKAAPTKLCENLTRSEFHNHNEIFIQSNKVCSDTSVQADIYAITGSKAMGRGDEVA
jgi:hypothetical protein